MRSPRAADLNGVAAYRLATVARHTALTQSFFSDPKIQIDLLEKPIIVATSAVVIPKP